MEIVCLSDLKKLTEKKSNNYIKHRLNIFETKEPSHFIRYFLKFPNHFFFESKNFNQEELTTHSSDYVEMLSSDFKYHLKFVQNLLEISPKTIQQISNNLVSYLSKNPDEITFTYYFIIYLSIKRPKYCFEVSQLFTILYLNFPRIFYQIFFTMKVKISKN